MHLPTSLILSDSFSSFVKQGIHDHSNNTKCQLLLYMNYVKKTVLRQKSLTVESSYIFVNPFNVLLDFHDVCIVLL